MTKTLSAPARVQSKQGSKRSRRIRVLVADDSVVIRRLVSHVLGEDPELEVVGTAADGAITLQKIPQVNPDVITLDVEMPVMNGLEALREIRKLYPKLHVIMFSTLTERGASATIDALVLGANDYVTKASNDGSLDKSLGRLRDELIPKIKQFFPPEPEFEPVAPVAQAQGGAILTAQLIPRAAARQREIVAIGVSTGGPTALAEIVPTFPADFPLPVVLVQHMPPMFTRLLADRLQAKSKLRVVEATEGLSVEPGTIFIAPGDYHMRLRRTASAVQITLDQSPAENSCRPAVDVLFRSVSRIYGGSAIAVVLTGMGSDGLRGVEHLKTEGAFVIAQDEASSVVWGMPGAVVRAGLADATVNLRSVTKEILMQAGR
jgi:two-component system, chemotaxis family, protein-glutamate methylesterase/glutaminase